VFINDWKVVGPELFLGIAVQLLVVLGVWYGSRPPYSVLVRPIKALSLLTAGLTLWLIARGDIFGSVWNESFSFNESTRMIHIWILIGCLVSLALANNKTVYENSLFILFSALGMIGLAASQDFLAFYLTLELQSFCFYIMAATRRTSQYSTESGLKYFILGAIASGFLLFGGSLLYGATGSLCFSDWMLLSQVEKPMFFQLGMVFFFVGLLFKLSAFPFHVWTPDVYEGAPTFITAFFALVPKIAVLALFFRLLSTSFYSSIEQWNGFSILVSSSRLEVGEPITFYVNTTAQLTWQLGDGTTNTGKKISHVFQKPGQYKIEAYNADKTQRNRIEILVLCSSEYVLNKINVIQKAAYSNDEKWLLKSIDEFKKLFKSNGMLIDLNQANQGKSNRKFADVDSFIDYFLVRTEQNKEKGFVDLSVINGVRQLETATESSLLSKITLYE